MTSGSPEDNEEEGVSMVWWISCASASDSVFFSIIVVVSADILEGVGGDCGDEVLGSVSSRVLRRFRVTLFEFGVVGKFAIRVGVAG